MNEQLFFLANTLSNIEVIELEPEVIVIEGLPDIDQITDQYFSFLTLNLSATSLHFYSFF